MQKKFRSIIILAFLGMSFNGVSSAESVSGKKIYVKADSKAEYSVVGEIETNAKGNLEIVTKRVSSYGKSYSKREVNCSSMTFRYQGDGDTLEEMKASPASLKMSSLVSGSSSDVISRFACRHG